MSVVFTAEVDISEFMKWADNSKLMIETMKSTLLEVSRLIHNNTNPLVPYDTGLLEKSYKEAVHTEYPIVEVEIGYSVTYNPKGKVWDYALIQHEQYPVKRKRGRWFYLKDGIEMSKSEAMVMIEKDFLSALGV